LEDFWSRHIEPSGQPGLNYWEYFAERLTQLSHIINGSTILDLGTFDGNVLIKAMKKMKTNGFGIGADIYFDGFKDGREDVKELELDDKIGFVQTDANSLGFLPEIFQTVLANFVGWDDCFDFERLEFKSPDKIMAEIMRVLKPGGQVGIGAWVQQSDIDWIINEFKEYLPEYENNITCYSKENPKGQEIILENGGFKDIRVLVEKSDFVSPDSETFWRQMKQAAKGYFMQISEPDVLEGFKDKVAVDLQQLQVPEGIRFSKTVSFAFGIKPV
jgi:ubiquinone/menaquinone biosynthesis C-methylase UbiE